MVQHTTDNRCNMLYRVSGWASDGDQRIDMFLYLKDRLCGQVLRDFTHQSGLQRTVEIGAYQAQHVRPRDHDQPVERLVGTSL